MDEQPIDPNAATLTDAATPADAATLAAAGETPAQSGRYDFGDAQRLSALQLQQLEQVHERFARELATSLSALTRRTVKASGVSCHQPQPGDASAEPLSGGLVIVIDVHPVEAHVTLTMDSRVVFPLLEALLGSGMAGSGDIHRELTEIELSVLQDLHAVVIRELERAWRPAARLTFQVLAQQSDLRAARPGPPADGALTAALNLEIDGSGGQIHLLYPLRVGREIQGADSAAAPADAARRPEMMQQALFDRLKTAALVVEGRLLGATMTLRDLADLRNGDLLCLDVPLDQHVDVTVNGASRFAGRLTDAGRKKAIRIQEILPAKAGRQWAR